MMHRNSLRLKVSCKSFTEQRTATQLSTQPHKLSKQGRGTCMCVAKQAGSSVFGRSSRRRHLPCAENASGDAESMEPPTKQFVHVWTRAQSPLSAHPKNVFTAVAQTSRVFTNNLVQVSLILCKHAWSNLCLTLGTICFWKSKVDSEQLWKNGFLSSEWPQIPPEHCLKSVTIIMNSHALTILRWRWLWERWHSGGTVQDDSELTGGRRHFNPTNILEI